ncbi:phage tail assembly chaperone [Pseudomonas sp. TNT2022 ID642]|uniref:phage tail assembly chaperone n=1 Tax=Pseudomonas sp. TNT2022 ID642 TaxID=2942632 RepID=UPI00235FDD28|nr:phage tail assembly chaperone [Pseudomonas sp. TNT2022 ID642]MDD1000471.1 phage tail assembly chaperone [Pseudomonas sp. TNT2022 ID642]
MTIYFYAQSLGFDRVDSALPELPEGAVEITQAQYAELFAGQANGKVISASASGQPVLTDPLIAPIERASDERAWRNHVLQNTQWLVFRDAEELEVGGGTTLRTEEFKELLAYRQALRDWPNQPDFPDARSRPVEPDWLEDLLRTHG